MRTVNLLTTARQHRPTRAFVLHECDASAYGTVHPLRLEGSVWRTGPGKSLSRDALAEALRKLAGLTHQREIIPEHVLYTDPGRTLWYRPARRAPAFFHTGRRDFDQAMQGAQALYPALLFLAVPRNLYLWALDSDRRPTGSTPLFQAPLLNVYDTGHLCSGTTKLPLNIGLEVEPFERALYETTFTHSNLRERLTSHPEGHDGLWRTLARPDCKEFPTRWLVPLKQGKKRLTVGEVLNREVRA